MLIYNYNAFIKLIIVLNDEDLFDVEESDPKKYRKLVV